MNEAKKHLLVVREFADTERSFCNSLAALLCVYVKPMTVFLMNQKGAPYPLRSTADSNMILTFFNQIEQMLALSTKLLVDLQGRAEKNETADESLGRIMLKYAVMFEIYSTYANCHAGLPASCLLCLVYRFVVNSTDDEIMQR